MARYLIPIWFLVATLGVIYLVVRSGGIGGDAVIYHRAAVAWTTGGNPWDASIPSVNGETRFHFYALPTAVILLAPVTTIPEAWVPFLGVSIQAAAAVYVVRRLQLGWWWLIFPPTVSGVLSGNPSITLLALLLAHQPIANAIGPLLKVYGGLPLLVERRWRAVATALLATGLSVVVFPDLWRQFLSGAIDRERLLMMESGGGFSAYVSPWLFVATVGALLVIARENVRAAGWLIPIALWPASQFHWATMALPVLPLWALLPLALHYRQLPPIVVIAYAVAILLRRLERWRDVIPPTSPFARGGIARERTDRATGTLATEGETPTAG